MATYQAVLGNYTHRLVVVESSSDPAANTSLIAWSYTIIRNVSAANGAFGTKSWNISIAGTPYSGTTSFDFRNYVELVIALGTLTVAHNPDGTKTINSWAYWPPHTTGMPGGTVGGDLTLTTLPRNRAKVGIDGEWEDCELFVGVNGEWKMAQPFVGVDDTWKQGAQ